MQFCRKLRYRQSKSFMTAFISFSTDASLQKTKEFLIERGYSETLSSEIMSSLLTPTTGITRNTIYDMVVSLAGAYEIGEDNGLIPLAKSVEIEVARKEGKAEVNFFARLPSGTTVKCSGLEGMSLKDVVEHGTDINAEVIGQYLECACSGIMACSTCQVYVSDKWVERLNVLNPVSEAELDMIDLAFEPRDNSRLGCQIKLHRNLEGIEFEIPGGSNNIFDPIPFQD